MNFLGKFGEQASERIKQGREQLSATIQRSTTNKQTTPRQSQDLSAEAPGAEGRLGERSQSEAHSFFDSEYDTRMAAAKQQQLQQSKERSELTRLQQANKLLEAKIEMLRSNLEAARAGTLEQGHGEGSLVQGLQVELAQAKTQVAQLSETSELFKEQQVAAVQAAATSQKQLQRVQLELAGARNQVTELTKAVGQARKELQSSKVASRVSEGNGNLQSKLELAEKKAIDLDEAKQRLQEEREQQRQEACEQAAEVQRLSAALEVLQKESESKENQRLVADRSKEALLQKISDLRSELMTFRERGVKAETDSLAMQTQLLEQKDARQAQLQLELEAEKSKNEAMLHANQELKDEVSQLRQNLEDQESLQMRVTALNEEKAALHGKLQAAEAVAAESRQEAVDLRETSAAQLQKEGVTRGAHDGIINGLGLPSLATLPASVQENGSPSTFLRSISSAPHPDSPSSCGSPLAKDAATLANEVRQLKAQLQMATEKWARDKQMFAEDARELQRVSRLKDQLGSQVAKLKAQVEQHHDMTEELTSARKALEERAADSADAAKLKAEHQQLQEVLATWKLGTDSDNESADIIARLTARKEAAVSLSEELQSITQSSKKERRSLDIANAEIDRLRKELAKRGEDSAAVQRFQQELTDARAALNAAEKEAEAAASANEELCSRLKEVEDLRASLREAQETAASALQRLEESHEESSRLRAEGEEASKAAAELRSMVHQLQAEMRNASEAADVKLAELEAQSNDLSKQVRVLESKLQQKADEVLHSNATLESVREKGNSQHEDLKTLLRESQDRVWALSQSLDASQSKSSRLKSEAAVDSQASEEVNNQMRELQNMVALSQEAAADAQEQIRRLEKALESSTTALTEAAERAEAAEYKVAEMDSTLELLQSTAALDEDAAGELREAKAEVERLAGEASSLQAAAKAAEQGLERASRETCAAEETVRGLQNDLEQSGCALSEAQSLSSKLERQNEELQASLESLRSQSQQEGVAGKGVEQDLENSQRALVEAQEAVEKLEGQNRELQDVLESVHKQTQQVEVGLRKEVQQFQQELAESQKTVSLLEDRNRDLESSLGSQQAEFRDTSVRQREVERELEQSRQALAEAQESVCSLAAEKDELQLNLKDLQSQCQANAALSQQLLQSNEALSDARKTVSHLEGQKAELQERLDDLTEKSSKSTQERDDAAEKALGSQREAAAAKLAEVRKELQSKLEFAVQESAERLRMAEAATSTAKELEEKASKAAARADALEEEKRLLAGQMQKLDESWLAERAGLKEKLERLQKANRERRQEAELMKEQLASATKTAANEKQAQQELSKALNELKELEARVEAAEGEASKERNLRTELQEANSRSSTAVSKSQEELSELSSSLSAVTQEREELLQEVVLLKSASVAKDALQGQVASLTRDLDAAKEGLEEAQKQKKQAENVEHRLKQIQKEAEQTSRLLLQAQQKQHQAEEQSQVASELLKTERAQREADARMFSADLEGLASRSQSSWPPSLRNFFQQRETAAAKAAASAVQAEAEAVEERLEGELTSLRAEARTAAAQRDEAVSARNTLEAQVVNLTAERKDLAASAAHTAERQLIKERMKAETRCRDLEEQVETARKEAESSRDAANKAAAARDAALRELEEVKQRAKALLEEKDAHLQATLSRTLSRSESLPGDPSSPLPISRGAANDTFTPRAHAQPTDLAPAQGDFVLPTLASQSSVSEITPASEILGTKPVQRSTRIQALQERVTMLEHELQDSDRTHKLRDRAQEVAKAEIAELLRSKARESLDVDYLKAVLLKGFESGELPSSSSLLPVLARLLHFSKEELAAVHTPRNPTKILLRK